MKIISKPIDKIIQENMAAYGTYVICHRALPMLEDGMKPVYRRILFTMLREQAFLFKKSQNIDGSTLLIHPHGSVYGTMVNMVQKERNQLPLIIGKGNFGSFLSNSIEPAAPRYTEVKLSSLATEILKDTKEHIVGFIPSYDGTIQVPKVLATKIPLVLLNANSGIAVGMSSSLGSFNINEVCDGIIKFLEQKEKTILIPDFATGGLIENNQQIFENINNVGIGSINLRAKYEIEDNNIIITELPYGVKKENVVSKIKNIIKNGTIKEITNVHDLTGLKGLSIEIVCKKNSNVDLIIEQLYLKTPLQSTFSFNMNLICNNIPIVLGVWDIIEKWLIWRKQCIVNDLLKTIEQSETKLHFLYGLQAVLLDIDKAIEIIRHSKTEQIILKLINFFKIDKIQAEEIANMKLRNINEEYIVKKIAEIQKLKEYIDKMKYIVENDDEKNKIIIKEMNEIKSKYGFNRKTQTYELSESKIKLVKQKEKEIEKIKDLTPSIIVVTNQGYVKKLVKDCPLDSHKLKEDDYVIEKFAAINSDELLVFSDTECYKIPIKELSFDKPSDFGTYIKSYLKIDDDIKAISLLNDLNKYFIICYADGRITKIDMHGAYNTKTQRKKLLNALRIEDIVFTITLPEDVMLEITTSKKLYKFNTNTLSAKIKKDNKGVKIWNCEKETFSDYDYYTSEDKGEE